MSFDISKRVIPNESVFLDAFSQGLQGLDQSKLYTEFLVKIVRAAFSRKVVLLRAIDLDNQFLVGHLEILNAAYKVANDVSRLSLGELAKNFKPSNPGEKKALCFTVVGLNRQVSDQQLFSFISRIKSDADFKEIIGSTNFEGFFLSHRKLKYSSFFTTLEIEHLKDCKEQQPKRLEKFNAIFNCQVEGALKTAKIYFNKLNSLETESDQCEFEKIFIRQIQKDRSFKDKFLSAYQAAYSLANFTTDEILERWKDTYSDVVKRNIIFGMLQLYNDEQLISFFRSVGQELICQIIEQDEDLNKEFKAIKQMSCQEFITLHSEKLLYTDEGLDQKALIFSDVFNLSLNKCGNDLVKENEQSIKQTALHFFTTKRVLHESTEIEELYDPETRRWFLDHYRAACHIANFNLKTICKLLKLTLGEDSYQTAILFSAISATAYINDNLLLHLFKKAKVYDDFINMANDETLLSYYNEYRPGLGSEFSVLYDNLPPEREVLMVTTLTNNDTINDSSAISSNNQSSAISSKKCRLNGPISQQSVEAFLAVFDIIYASHADVEVDYIKNDIVELKEPCQRMMFCTMPDIAKQYPLGLPFLHHFHCAYKNTYLVDTNAISYDLTERAIKQFNQEKSPFTWGNLRDQASAYRRIAENFYNKHPEDDLYHPVTKEECFKDIKEGHENGFDERKFRQIYQAAYIASKPQLNEIMHYYEGLVKDATKTDVLFGLISAPNISDNDLIYFIKETKSVEFILYYVDRENQSLISCNDPRSFTLMFRQHRNCSNIYEFLKENDGSDVGSVRVTAEPSNLALEGSIIPTPKKILTELQRSQLRKACEVHHGLGKNKYISMFLDAFIELHYYKILRKSEIKMIYDDLGLDAPKTIATAATIRPASEAVKWAALSVTRKVPREVTTKVIATVNNSTQEAAEDARPSSSASNQKAPLAVTTNKFEPLTSSGHLGSAKDAVPPLPNSTAGSSYRGLSSSTSETANLKSASSHEWANDYPSLGDPTISPGAKVAGRPTRQSAANATTAPTRSSTASATSTTSSTPTASSAQPIAPKVASLSLAANSPAWQPRSSPAQGDAAKGGTKATTERLAATPAPTQPKNKPQTGPNDWTNLRNNRKAVANSNSSREAARSSGVGRGNNNTSRGGARGRGK
jgi:hypothetical protein